MDLFAFNKMKDRKRLNKILIFVFVFLKQKYKFHETNKSFSELKFLIF